mmetsp:Transcript_442/g.912  ORF Transcript_442/g.912 Transcript_442/m.912 type:complete len:736 (+) Transcript_442:126-2333(+)
MLKTLCCNGRAISWSAKKLLSASSGMTYRGYHFGTAQYYAAFNDLPTADTAALRKATLEYLSSIDKKLWFNQPIQSFVYGKALDEGDVIDTVDAHGKVNGKQLVGNENTFKAVVELVERLTAEADTPSSAVDYREAIAKIEQLLLSPQFASQLIGNQALDFLKQDGITEIEESVMANAVERKMNLELRADEEGGKIAIGRHPAFVACVSNFTNFLDLFRKTLRNLELGVPVVVLSRSNTSQHCFRWYVLLQKMVTDHGLPSHLLTFASLNLEHQRQLFKRFPKSPVYFTGSREVAKALKEIAPKAISSTGGPNTMVNTAMNPAISESIRMSACIENSGQCTALRHVVQAGAGSVGDVTAGIKANVFPGSLPRVAHPSESLEAGTFFALFKDGPFAIRSGYEQHGDLPVALRVGTELPQNIQENWREVYLDVTNRSEDDLKWEKADEKDGFLQQLCKWLLTEQPISLSVNGPYELGLKLWERTSQVVFTQGSHAAPALSCQARPQEGECFGEFAPRSELLLHSRFPVVIPSPTPAYNSAYTPSFLTKTAQDPLPSDLAFCEPLLQKVTDPAAKGFCKVVLEYLRAASEGPWEGKGARTCLFGVQRTPLGAVTVIRLEKGVSFDAVCPYLLPFFATNARDAVELSVEGGAPAATTVSELKLPGVKVTEETAAALEKRVKEGGIYNVVRPEPMAEFPMPGQFVSTLLCVGHCKSVQSNDKLFLDLFRSSPKWIRINAP